VCDWRERLLAEARREAWHVLATDRQRRRSRIQSKQSAGHWQVVGNRARLRKFRSEGDSVRPGDAIFSAWTRQSRSDGKESKSNQQERRGGTQHFRTKSVTRVMLFAIGQAEVIAWNYAAHNATART